MLLKGVPGAVSNRCDRHQLTEPLASLACHNQQRFVPAPHTAFNHALECAESMILCHAVQINRSIEFLSALSDVPTGFPVQAGGWLGARASKPVMRKRPVFAGLHTGNPWRWWRFRPITKRRHAFGDLLPNRPVSCIEPGRFFATVQDSSPTALAARAFGRRSQ